MMSSSDISSGRPINLSDIIRNALQGVSAKSKGCPFLLSGLLSGLLTVSRDPLDEFK